MPTLHLVSDTHLSNRAPSGIENWSAVLNLLAEVGASLVIHGGDISMDGAGDHLELDLARSHLDRLHCPWFAVPGNHDLGDPTGANRTDDRRRAAYEMTIGPRMWSTTLDGWQLVGFDIQQLCDDETPHDDAWRWLEEALQTAQPTVVFQHRPLRPPSHAQESAARYVEEPTRTRLENLFRDRNVQCVVSGHVHQHLVFDDDGLRHVWIPSTWASLPDDVQPAIGEKRLGVVELVLGETIQARLLVPPTIRHEVVGVTSPSPYRH